MSDNIVHAEDWPHGLRCIDCHDLIEDGSPYSERLTSMIEGTPVVEIVCVPCGLGLATAGERQA
jgi:hypothetical protein